MAHETFEGVLLAFGDAIEQRLEMSWGKGTKYDLRRTGIFTLIHRHFSVCSVTKP